MIQFHIYFSHSCQSCRGKRFPLWPRNPSALCFVRSLYVSDYRSLFGSQKDLSAPTTLYSAAIVDRHENGFFSAQAKFIISCCHRNGSLCPHVGRGDFTSTMRLCIAKQPSGWMEKKCSSSASSCVHGTLRCNGQRAGFAYTYRSAGVFKAHCCRGARFFAAGAQRKIDALAELDGHSDWLLIKAHTLLNVSTFHLSTAGDPIDLTANWFITSRDWVVWNWMQNFA